MTESLQEILRSEGQRIAECCVTSDEVSDEAIRAFLEASGWSVELVPAGDFAWRHTSSGTTAGDVTEALATALALYRERSIGWPAFAASCWRRD